MTSFGEKEIDPPVDRDLHRRFSLRLIDFFKQDLSSEAGVPTEFWSGGDCGLSGLAACPAAPCPSLRKRGGAC